MARISTNSAETKPFLSSETEDEQSENTPKTILSYRHVKLVPWVLHLVMFVVYTSLYVFGTKRIIAASTTSLHREFSLDALLK